MRASRIQGGYQCSRSFRRRTFLSLNKTRLVLVCSGGGVEDAANLRRRSPVDPVSQFIWVTLLFPYARKYRFFPLWKIHSNRLNRPPPGILLPPFIPPVLTAKMPTSLIEVPPDLAQLREGIFNISHGQPISIERARFQHL